MAVKGSKKSRGSQKKGKVTSRSRKTSKKTKNKTRQLIKLGNSSDMKLPVEDIKAQLLSYADQIQGYLGEVNAKVDAFNFGVEKGENGITIACEVKAVIGA